MPSDRLPVRLLDVPYRDGRSCTLKESRRQPRSDAGLMAYTLEDKLVVAISSRALFALEEADAIYREQGLDAYHEYQ